MSKRVVKKRMGNKICKEAVREESNILAYSYAGGIEHGSNGACTGFYSENARGGHSVRNG
jgi:hypothetical protein